MDDGTRLYGLVIRAGVWEWAVERLSNAAAENKMCDAHMCALALHHLERCVDMIRRRCPVTSEEKTLLKTFSRASKKARLRDLRNALEHEEQHFSGYSRDPKKIYRGEDFSPPAIAWDSTTNRLRWIYALDVRYEIGEAADAAIALRDTLRELAERTWPGKAMDK